jgi:hypothetical protein
MNSKNHKKNTNFQILHFLVGSCHTPDAAYSLLLDLREEREQTLKQYHTSRKKNKAKYLRLKNDFNCASTEWDKLEIEAEIEELFNSQNYADSMLPATEDELKFINECIEKVQPLRKYKDLPDIEANEASQQEEWREELIWRAQNYLCTDGRIPADHLATMRTHPDFRTHIAPAVSQLQTKIMAMGMSSNPIEIKKLSEEIDDMLVVRKLLT